MGVLDIVNGYRDIDRFLKRQKNLGDDLLALKRASKAWRKSLPIDVGESGTLFRLLQFSSWKLGLNKVFVKRATLRKRSITDNPNIVNFSLSELLRLDNGTSQWATASILLGNKEKIEDPPFKLALTYEALHHWQSKRRKRKVWMPRHDETILSQAQAFLYLLKNKKIKFIPKQAEDFCFALAFDLISVKQGEKLWPSLRGHESNRIEETKKALDALGGGRAVISKDHRVVQAVAMKAFAEGKKIKIKHPKSVSKSWPQFWEFLSFAKKYKA